MNTPYNIGVNAYQNGFHESNNPYPEMSDDYFDWSRGYYDAKQEDWEDTYREAFCSIDAVYYS